jgi:hypothetical protein
MTSRAFLLAAVLAAACGHARIPDQALEGDLSKADPTAVARLEAARGKVSEAQGEVASAAQQVSAAREQRAAVEKDRERAKALAEQAEARKRAAEAHDAYAGKLVEAREAAVELARRRVAVAEAEVELSKLLILEGANPVTVAKFDKSDFQGEVVSAQKRLEDATRELAEREEAARKAEARWQELAREAPEQP